MFASYCCEMPLNVFWRYCPFCGTATDTKRRIDIQVADEQIERMEKRDESVRGHDLRWIYMDEVRSWPGGETSPSDEG